MVVFVKAFVQIVGDAGVEGVVATAENIDVIGHADRL
jgi:hypothetical protein